MMLLLDVVQEKALYRDAFERLRGLKTEIEHRQRIAGQDRARHRAAFGRWLAVMRRQAGLPAPTEAQLSGGDTDAHDSVGGADRTAAGASSDTLPTAPASTSSAGSSRIEVSAADTAAAGEAAGRSTRAARPATAARPQRPAPAAAELPLHAVTTMVHPRDDLRDETAMVAADESQGSQASRALRFSGTSADPAKAPLSQPDADPYADVDPEVLQAAKPMLTGSFAADRSIIQFYEARAALLRSQAFRSTL